MQEFPQDGFAELFIESLTDEETQKIGGGSSVPLDDENQALSGWTDSSFPDEFDSALLSNLPLGKTVGDIDPHSQS